MDLELNRLTKALFLAQVVLSVVMVALQGFVGPWFRNLFRFVVLFSYIIPIRYFVFMLLGTRLLLLISLHSLSPFPRMFSNLNSRHVNPCQIFNHVHVFMDSLVTCSLRVNLDMGKSAYGWMIMKDENIPGTVVRTSTIPEELGRLVYLLTDKTGRCRISA